MKFVGRIVVKFLSEFYFVFLYLLILIYELQFSKFDSR